MVEISIFILLLTFTNVMSRYLLVDLHRDQDANQSSARIYGGYEVKDGERPYQLLVIADPHLPNQQVSGGTLIHKTWALTAAHCVTEPPSIDVVSSLSVSGGSPDRKNSNIQTQEIDTKANVFPHPSWDWTLTSGYDIALIRLPKEFQQATGININTIDMNMVHPINYYEGKVLTFSGWGNTEKFKFEFPEKLHAVDLQIVKTEACWDGKCLSPERVLQAKQDGGKSACRGDSGGPVTYNDGKKETLAGVIIGISEIKSGRCGDSNEYSLAVSVHSHKDWIQKTMAK